MNANANNTEPRSSRDIHTLRFSANGDFPMYCINTIFEVLAVLQWIEHNDSDYESLMVYFGFRGLDVPYKEDNPTKILDLDFEDKEINFFGDPNVVKTAFEQIAALDKFEVKLLY